MTLLRQRMLEDLQIRRYSPTTIRIYLRRGRVCPTLRQANRSTRREYVRLYQLFLIKEKRVSLPTLYSDG